MTDDPTSGIRVGEPDVEPDTPAHTPGTRQGNRRGSYAKQAGLLRDDHHDARRSTGIRAKDRNTQVGGSPHLSPP